MRCPKCQYLSFDNGDRCRNCGYEFSLAIGAAPLDLAIQDGTEAIGPLADLELRKAAEARPVHAAATLPPIPDTGSLELPLFTPAGKNAPPPGPPRPPLGVRRNAPVAAKPKPAGPRVARATVEEPRLALDTAEMPIVRRPDGAAAGKVFAPVHEEHGAPAGARVLAAIIDLAIVGGIDAGVLYLTLRVLELHLIDARALPLIPFLAFLLLLNGSYFAAFVAAGGQTIGKMAASIRVVPGATGGVPNARVPVGSAIVRAAAYVVSVLPAGAGFLPGLMSADHRALHDRLADTRVVKA
jgi:uncharacterized RDD family membrane protein YckC